MLVAWVPLSQGCIPVYMPVEKSIYLQEPSVPMVPAALLAPKAAQPISVIRPIRANWGEEIHRRGEVYTTGFAAVGGGVEFLVFEDQHFVPSVDPAVWVADGLIAGLENAGYQVKGPGGLASSLTPVAITVDVKELSAKDMGGAGSPGCEARIVAEIRVLAQRKPVFDRTYYGEHRTWRFCTDDFALTLGTPPDPEMGPATRKALENLLDQAVPQLAAVLAPIARQRSASPAVLLQDFNRD